MCYLCNVISNAKCTVEGSRVQIMEGVRASIKRVTLGKSINIAETLFPSLEIRADSPSPRSKETSRYKRALVLYKQKRAVLESVMINIC